MKILVLATDDRWNELTVNNTAIEWMRSENIDSFLNDESSDAYFNLSDNAATADHAAIKKPVFLNSVAVTLKETNAAENVFRINGWKGFLKRNSWEVAGDLNADASAVLAAMNKHAVPVPDEPGFIAARIISMIINEAYFAKEQNVSTKEEIDIAMKLGTNYPFGPFEWAKLIGIKQIHSLLQVLSKNDERYTPASLLEKEAADNQ